MGEAARRVELVQGINAAFGPEQIAATARRVVPLRPGADFLDICQELGLLAPVIDTDFRAYRRNLTMPPLSRRIMTTVFRASLLSRPEPTPMNLTIRNGRTEGIQVTMTPDLISVVLTRTVPAIRRPG